MRVINSPEVSETEKAVADYLKSQHVEFSAVYIGAKKLDEWECDGWRVSLKGPAGRAMATDYHTGLGHRKSARKMPPDLRKCNPRSIAAVHWTRENVVPVFPPAAGVLYSLLLDARGAEQPFDDWASDLGFDTDSLKALNTYNACCEIRRNISAMFTREQREHLSTLLEDY